MLKFTDDHEWLRVDGTIAVIGITGHAQEQLGDIVFVDLPTIGARFVKGQPVAVVESVKAASDVYMPSSGEIVGVNEEVLGDPTLINADPMGKGWMFKMRIADLTEIESLKDEAAYRAMVG